MQFIIQLAIMLDNARNWSWSLFWEIHWSLRRYLSACLNVIHEAKLSCGQILRILCGLSDGLIDCPSFSAASSLSSSPEHKNGFYRASLGLADRGIDMASCPTVCVCDVEPSSTLRWGIVIMVYKLEFCKNDFTAVTSLNFSLCPDPNTTDLLQREHPTFSRNRSEVGKIVDFRHLSRHIVITQDRDRRFRLVPKLMTLNDERDSRSLIA